MDFAEYQNEASRTALYPERLNNLGYPTLGLAGEAGEVANIVKKIQRDHGGKLNDEIKERLKDELGDVLFVVANIARTLEIEPEDALRSTNAKFARRFRFIEAALAERGKTPADSDLAEMDALWDAAKAAEKAGA